MKLLLTLCLIIISFTSNSQEVKEGPVSDTTVLEEVILQSTRTSRTIQNEPTRVETIEEEEIDEKNNMRPANVMMLLHESTGITVLQTSANSGNASISLQGVDGRYTQLLKDGFPNYGNFASGLSILEIAPLDLKQVEIIKGPASTLYGGGAIAGVINFISKTPGDRPELNFLVNQSTVGHTNIGVFTSKRMNKTGYTVLGLYNTQNPYDKDRDHFTEIPESSDFTISPCIYYYPDENTTIRLGNTTTVASRTGGDIGVIRRGPFGIHQFFERNETTRSISTFIFDKIFKSKNRLLIKQGFSIFTRTISMPSYLFGGVSHTAFTDVSYIINKPQHSFVLGGNFIYDNFDEKQRSGARDNRSFTTGGYIQHTWDAAERIQLETGIRVDGVQYNNDQYKKTEYFFLPRISLLLKLSDHVSSRIGGGFGYKAPTLFTEKTEIIAYENVQQLTNIKSEKSYGTTADINIKTRVNDELAISINQMFFYSIIHDPLLLTAEPGGNRFFQNAAGNIRTMGFETNARLIYKEDLKLFLGYTFTDAQALYLPGKQYLPLVPKGKLNSALIFEKESNFKMGLEGYFTGKQYLSDGSRTPSFLELGFMVEKTLDKVSAFINFENFTNTRQSKYKAVVSGQHIDPQFDEIWTHTEGFMVNAGVKIRL